MITVNYDYSSGITYFYLSLNSKSSEALSYIQGINSEDCRVVARGITAINNLHCFAHSCIYNHKPTKTNNHQILSRVCHCNKLKAALKSIQPFLRAHVNRCLFEPRHQFSVHIPVMVYTCVSDLDVFVVEDGDQVPHEAVVGVEPRVFAVHVHLQVFRFVPHQLEDELVLLLVLLLPVVSPGGRVLVRQEGSRDTAAITLA